MRIRWLGKTGLQVSEICVGTAVRLAGSVISSTRGPLNQAEADRLVNIALDAGVNFF